MCRRSRQTLAETPGDRQLVEATGAGAGHEPVRGGGGVPVPALDGGHAGLAVASRPVTRRPSGRCGPTPAEKPSRPLERSSCERRGLAPTVPNITGAGPRVQSGPGAVASRPEPESPHPSQPRERQTIPVVDKGVPHGG